MWMTLSVVSPYVVQPFLLSWLLPEFFCRVATGGKKEALRLRVRQLR